MIMSRCINLLIWGNILIMVPLANAQEVRIEELVPGTRDRAIIMDIAARVIEQNQEVVWNSEESRTTIPGRPVGVKLVGSNIAIEMQFTPYLRRGGQNILVAQGQIWINIPDKGISYHTVMQTIPVQFDEEIHFFPLGSAESRNEAVIEIQLVLRRFRHQQGSRSGEHQAAPAIEGNAETSTAENRDQN